MYYVSLIGYILFFYSFLCVYVHMQSVYQKHALSIFCQTVKISLESTDNFEQL